MQAVQQLMFALVELDMHAESVIHSIIVSSSSLFESIKPSFMVVSSARAASNPLLHTSSSYWQENLELKWCHHCGGKVGKCSVV